ncbi:MAG: hypothetical protein QG635_1289 [Bacteroidota bacterium]|nr:hypothetical protein [Bacteroidota bacterium]
MDKIDKSLKSAFKEAEIPDISTDFTKNLMQEIQQLPSRYKAKPKPLINPYILFGIPALLLTLLIYTIENISKTSSRFGEFLSFREIIHYIQHLTGNYMIAAFAVLVLIWFIFDYIISYKLIQSKRT